MVSDDIGHTIMLGDSMISDDFIANANGNVFCSRQNEYMYTRSVYVSISVLGHAPLYMPETWYFYGILD